MRFLKITALMFFAAALVMPAAFTSVIQRQSMTTRPESFQSRLERFQHAEVVEDEDSPAVGTNANATEAPTGFDNLTNGFNEQGPPFDSINGDNVVALRSFNDNRFIFEEVEHASDGLGPTYNAQSCGECHQNVATGGASQIAEHRTGRVANNRFFESLGGSLIQSRATNPEIMERVAFDDGVRTFRISTNTLGNGYIECIANGTITAIRDQQPAQHARHCAHSPCA